MTLIDTLKTLGWSGIWDKVRIYVYIAFIIAAVSFFFWCQAQIENMKTTAYNNGVSAATATCEATKAAAIIKGTQSRERIDRDFQSKDKNNALNYLRSTGRLRPQ